MRTPFATCNTKAIKVNFEMDYMYTTLTPSFYNACFHHSVFTPFIQQILKLGLYDSYYIFISSM